LEHNILFGRVTTRVADAASRVRQVMRATLDELDLRGVVLEAGLGFMVGAGGRRLSQPQRQKVALARALLKQPDLLIVNRGLNALSSRSQQAIMGRITAATRAQAAADHAATQAHTAVPDTAKAEARSTKAPGKRSQQERGNGLANGQAAAGFLHLATTGGEVVAGPAARLPAGAAALSAEVTAGAVFWVLANPALDQARAFDRIVVFEDGHLVEDGPARSLQPASRALKFLS
jgi:hypothetical protein